MPDLRERIAQCGFDDVISYLPTGNIVLTDPLARGPSDVASRLEQGVARTGLIRTDAAVWRPPELLELVATDPFADRYPVTSWRRCASFLHETPGRDGKAAVTARGAVVVHADHRVVLTAFPRDWTTFDLRLEHAYQVSATTRWWNVVVDFTHKHLRSPKKALRSDVTRPGPHASPLPPAGSDLHLALDPPPAGLRGVLPAAILRG